MPDGYEIAQRGRGGFRGGGMRGGFPHGGFPGRFPRRRFPRFFFFPPYYTVPPSCYYIDQFGRCCDYYGNCYYNDYYGGASPQSSDSGDSVAAWSQSDSWERIDEGMDDGRYDQY